MKETPYLQGREHLVEQFKRLPFLKSFDSVHFREIMELSKIRMYEEGENIIPEGAFDTWIYILISGAVKVVKGDDEIARLDHVGDIFGELGIIDKAARSASVYAVKNTVCLAIDASFLDRINERDKTVVYSVLYRMFAEILAHRLRITSNELAQTRKKLMQMEAKHSPPNSSLF